MPYTVEITTPPVQIDGEEQAAGCTSCQIRSAR